MKALLAAFIVFLLLALALWQLGQAGLLAAKAWAAPVLIERAWIQRREDGKDHRPWPWADSTPVATLSVPKLAVTRYVLDGDNMRNLAFGPVLQKSREHLLLFGHRDTHFKILKDLQIEDVVLFTEKTGEPEDWIVVSTAILPASDLSLPRTGGPRYMLLVTCYPFDGILPNTDKRFVVWLIPRPQKVAPESDLLQSPISLLKFKYETGKPVIGGPI